MFLQKPHIQLLQVLCWPTTQLILDSRGLSRPEVKIFREGSQMNGTVDRSYFSYLLSGNLILEVNRTPYQTYYGISRAGRAELEERKAYPVEALEATKEKEMTEKKEKEEESTREKETMQVGIPGVRAVAYKLPKGRGYVVTAYAHDLEVLKDLKKVLRLEGEPESMVAREAETAETAVKRRLDSSFDKTCAYCGTKYTVKVLKKAFRDCCADKACRKAYASEKEQLKKAKK